jgi:hypothetical protein
MIGKTGCLTHLIVVLTLSSLLGAARYGVLFPVTPDWYMSLAMNFVFCIPVSFVVAAIFIWATERTKASDVERYRRRFVPNTSEGHDGPGSGCGLAFRGDSR